MKNDDLFNIFANFAKFHSNTIGFDQLAAKLSSLSESMTKYPPYNIKKVDDNHYVLELAVAGFAKQDIDIEINNGTLAIRGKVESLQEDDQDYIFKGIANRSFDRTFALADNFEVKNAEMFNGLLRVWLEHIIPEHKKPKKIKVD